MRRLHVPSPRRRLVMLSKRGPDSFPPDVWAAVERLVATKVERLDAPPGAVEAVALLEGADVVAATNLCLPTIDVQLLDALPELKTIVLYATGYDHLDVALLDERGVELSVLPDYATVAVSEHAVAMVFALATRLHLAHAKSCGTAPAAASLRGLELSGRTAGVVGLGRIGRRTAALCRGLGMDVVGTDPDDAAATLAGVEGIAVVGLDELLGRADAVVLCASHRYGAAPIIGAPELTAMRADALLVNPARSALVDTSAAIALIRSGRLRGYAVDDCVIDRRTDGDLLDQGRVLQTGHSAWWRDEVLERGARMWGERVLAAVQGMPLDVVTCAAAQEAVG